MRKGLKILFLPAVVVFILFQFSMARGAELYRTPSIPGDGGSRTSITLNAGQRVDRFMWNIAGDINGRNPNILSELTWPDLKMFALKATARTSLEKSIYMRAWFEHGTILKGKNVDADYLGDFRTLEFSRSDNRADSGSAWDLSLGAGYRLGNVEEGLGGAEFIPMAGYSYHRQNLKITDGVQSIPPTGPFSGLDSSYSARWRGPWVGFEANVYGKTSSFLASLEYHFMTDYYAEADWNLRTDFQHPRSFEHTADGSGVVFWFDSQFHLSPPLSIDVLIEGQSWKADAGVDRTFFANGAVSDTRLNEVVWSSVAIMLGVVYRF